VAYAFVAVGQGFDGFHDPIADALIDQAV